MNYFTTLPTIYDQSYTPTYGITYDQNTSIENDTEWESEVDLIDLEDDDLDDEYSEEIIPLIEFPTHEMFEA